MDINPVELVSKDGKPIPPEESPVDAHEPPATTTTDNPFAGIPCGEFYDRLRWDGSLGGRRVRPSCDAKAKAKRLRLKKQKNQKQARRRNRK